MKRSEKQRASTVPHLYPCDTHQKAHTVEEPSTVPDDLLWVTSASSADALMLFQWPQWRGCRLCMGSAAWTSPSKTCLGVLVLSAPQNSLSSTLASERPENHLQGGR